MEDTVTAFQLEEEMETSLLHYVIWRMTISFKQDHRNEMSTAKE